MKTAARIMSMSGYGRGVAGGSELKLVCEIRSVNHRYLDAVISLPGSMNGYEPVLRKWLGAGLKRGRVEVTVSLTTPRGGSVVSPVFDESLARWYGRKLIALAKALGLDPPRAESIAQLPGVVGKGEVTSARMLPLLRQAVMAALNRLLAMRRREGGVLTLDVTKRLDALSRHVDWVADEWPKFQKRQREKTDSRLRLILERLGDEKRSGAVRDLVGALERGDVTEELIRLRSHLAQFKDTVRRGSPAGRKMDFLAQETQREIHTIGSKTPDALITSRVLEMKEEVERIREQVQNLE